MSSAATNTDVGACHSLPSRLTSFVGRERELTELRQLLETCRLLTLTGPGGCGRTRLALEPAAHLAPTYPEGVHVVSLTPIADPALVASAAAEAVARAGPRDSAARGRRQ